MSLINDALRRAKQQNKNPDAARSDGTPMQPAPPRPRSDRSSFGPIMIFLIALMLLVAGWFFWSGSQSRSRDRMVSNAQKVETPTEIVSPIPESPGSQIASIPPVSPIEVSPGSVASPSGPATVDLSFGVTREVPTVPKSLPQASNVPLKLQGIFFRLRHPTAMINGQTVAVGDFVAGARVLKIEREEVIVERGEHSEALRIE